MTWKPHSFAILTAGLILAPVAADAQADRAISLWVATGQEGAPCGSASSCATPLGFGCIDGVCLPVGGFGESCRPAGHPIAPACDSSLSCGPWATCVETPNNTDGRPIDIYANQGTQQQLLAMGAVFGRLSDIVYSSREVQRTKVSEVHMRHRSYIDVAGDAQAMVVEDDHAVVVVARGTELKSARDWFVNIGTQVTPLPGYGSTHLGFTLAAKALKDRIKTAINDSLAQRRTRKIWLTGHSLGGALAQILAAMLQVDGFQIAGVTTFGGPAAGNADWKTKYNARFGSVTHRWVNADDIVPCLPPAQDFWRHAGKQHYVSEGDVRFYDSTNYCVDFPDFVSPITAACERETRVARFLRRIFLDPANVLCATPDPHDAIWNAILNAAAGRGSSDHEIVRYVETLRDKLGMTGWALVPSLD